MGMGWPTKQAVVTYSEILTQLSLSRIPDKKRTHVAVVTYSEILFANKLKEDVEILHRRADSVTHYAYLISKALQ